MSEQDSGGPVALDVGEGGKLSEGSLGGDAGGVRCFPVTTDKSVKNSTGHQKPSTAAMNGCTVSDNSDKLSSTSSREVKIGSLASTGEDADKATCSNEGLTLPEHGVVNDEDEQTTISCPGESLEKPTFLPPSSGPSSDEQLDHPPPPTDDRQPHEVAKAARYCSYESHNNSRDDKLSAFSDADQPRFPPTGTTSNHTTVDSILGDSSERSVEGHCEPSEASFHEKGDIETRRGSAQYKICVANGNECVSISIDEEEEQKIDLIPYTQASDEDDEENKSPRTPNCKDELLEVKPSDHQDHVDTNSSSATQNRDSGYYGSPLSEKKQDEVEALTANDIGLDSGSDDGDQVKTGDQGKIGVITALSHTTSSINGGQERKGPCDASFVDDAPQSGGHAMEECTVIEGGSVQAGATGSAAQIQGLGIFLPKPPTTGGAAAPVPVNAALIRPLHVAPSPRAGSFGLQASQHSQLTPVVHPSPGNIPPHLRPQIPQQHDFPGPNNQSVISSTTHHQRKYNNNHNSGRFGNLGKDFDLCDRIARLEAENRKLRNDLEFERRANRDLRKTIEEENARASNEAMNSIIFSLFNEKKDIAKRSFQVQKAEIELKTREEKVQQQEVFLAEGQKTLKSLMIPQENRTLKPAEITLMRAQMETEFTAKYATSNAMLRAKVEELNIREGKIKNMEDNFDLHCREKIAKELECKMHEKMEDQARQDAEAAYWEGFEYGREERHAAEVEKIRQQAFEEGVKAKGMERMGDLGVLVSGFGTEKTGDDGGEQEANLMDL